jgi:hypothetical protein
MDFAGSAKWSPVKKVAAVIVVAAIIVALGVFGFEKWYQSQVYVEDFRERVASNCRGLQAYANFTFALVTDLGSDVYARVGITSLGQVVWAKTYLAPAHTNSPHGETASDVCWIDPQMSVLSFTPTSS